MQQEEARSAFPTKPKDNQPPMPAHPGFGSKNQTKTLGKHIYRVGGGAGILGG